MTTSPDLVRKVHEAMLRAPHDGQPCRQARAAVQAMQSDGLSMADLKVACSNVGLSLECGACAFVFFTGVTTAAHDDGCRSRQ